MVEQTCDFSKILDILKENPRGMSVREISEAAQINRNTTARYMDNLLVSGRVEMRTFGKAKVFFISKRVPVSAMLNLSTDMVLLVDSDLKVIQANESVISFLSCTREDILGTHVYDGSCKILCNDIFTEQIRSSLKGEMVKGEIRLIKDGRDCIIDERIYPMVLSDGRPGATVILYDITDKVNAEIALEQSEAMFRTLVESINDVIWSLDDSLIIEYVSPQIEKLTGYPADEVVGHPATDFVPNDLVPFYLSKLNSSKSQQSGFSLSEFPLICKDGRTIYCEFTGTPVFVKGEETVFIGYNGALHDVTEKIEAEHEAERLRRFFNIINSFFAFVKSDGTIDFINSFGASQLGYSPEELKGVPLFDMLISDEFREDALCRYKEVLSGADYSKGASYTFNAVCKNGDKIIISCRYMVVRYESENLLGAVFFSDGKA